MRAGLGNNNVDTCARVCHSPTGYGLSKTFGTSAGTQDFDSVDAADVVLVIGANPVASNGPRNNAAVSPWPTHTLAVVSSREVRTSAGRRTAASVRRRGTRKELLLPHLHLHQP